MAGGDPVGLPAFSQCLVIPFLNSRARGWGDEGGAGGPDLAVGSRPWLGGTLAY